MKTAKMMLAAGGLTLGAKVGLVGLAQLGTGTVVAAATTPRGERVLSVVWVTEKLDGTTRRRVTRHPEDELVAA